ncbi:MAG TPA: hypothetical protein VM100_04320 [Longimicrobiales bacterium]|nr:hypothetical protein [Longimicrobiales bacterium]
MGKPSSSTMVTMRGASSLSGMTALKMALLSSMVTSETAPYATAVV